MALTPEALNASATKFGRLWNWYDKRADEPFVPQFWNTEGHEVVLHTASFSIADDTDIRKILEDRSDIEYDVQQDEYVWFREQDNDARMPGDVTDRYKLTVYRGRDWGELFDLYKDPHELLNRFHDRDYADTKTCLMSQLVQSDLEREPTPTPRIAGA